MKERGEIGKEEGKEGSKAGKASLTFFEDGGRRESDLNAVIAGSRRR